MDSDRLLRPMIAVLVSRERRASRSLAAGPVYFWSDGTLGHLVRDVVRLPDRERYNRQRRIGRRAGAELASIGDEQVRDLMGLPPFVAYTILRPLAHAAAAHVVARGERGRLVDFLRAQRLVDRAALSKGVIAHPFVIDVIVIVDMRNSQAELILLGCISRDPVFGLG